MIERMKSGAQCLMQRCAAMIAVVSMLLLVCFLPAASAQNAPPPKPEDFKAMQQPGAPSNLTTAPAASLITPATGPVAPQPGFNGSRVVMTQAVWRDYVRYLQNDVAVGYGIFMVTVDGAASDVKQCNNYACQISPISQSTALSECQAKQRNRRCVIFAEGRAIKYAYQVVP
jgi:hypothetical protein